jgi:hypothetical protein
MKMEEKEYNEFMSIKSFKSIHADSEEFLELLNDYKKLDHKLIIKQRMCKNDIKIYNEIINKRKMIRIMLEEYVCVEFRSFFHSIKELENDNKE